ncbi:MAG: hypothetical protein HRT89_23875, partial [Lentisphaeria bacterium]|nr:DUF5915 domain-containing protein [Lentisphaeria bacterium]NQZ71098.1 hypothetical protein [Lentisphaeria bacterium]
ANQVKDFSVEEISSIRDGNAHAISFEDGSSYNLTIDDIDLRREEKEGLAVANEGDITIALDLTITEDLELDGIAQEIKHIIQDLRKEMDLQVTDRIVVELNGDDKILKSLKLHATYIATETLADALDVNETIEDSIEMPNLSGFIKVTKV